MQPTTRRGLFAAAALLPLAGLAAPRRAAGAKTVAEHFTSGGMNGVSRARFGFTGTSSVSGYPTIQLPKASNVYAIPLTVSQFDESAGALFSLAGDGTVLINATRNYRVAANLDWPAQHGVDVGTRKLLVYRCPNGVAPPPYVPGQVAMVKSGNGYDSLCAHDTPGSNAPRNAHAAQAFPGATLAPGAVLFVDVPLADPSVAIARGDVARAALADDGGAGAAGLVVTAVVTGQNAVRVWFENRYSTGTLTLPPSTVNVLAETTTTTTGNSEDAWAFVQSPTVQLQAGERVFVAVRSEAPGDFLQVDNLSFLQLETVGAA